MDYVRFFHYLRCPSMQNKVNFPSQVSGANSTSFSKDYAFKFGETLFKSGNFKKSISVLKEVRIQLFEAKDFPALIKCYNMLIQALYEGCRFDELKAIEREFQDFCEKYEKTKSVKHLYITAWYTTLLRAITFKNYSPQEESEYRLRVESLLKEALTKALEKQSESVEKGDRLNLFRAKLDVMLCLQGYTYYYFSVGEFDKCEDELKQVKVLLDYYYSLRDSIKEEQSKTDNVQEQAFFRELLKNFEEEEEFIKRVELSVLWWRALLLFQSQKIKESKKVLWDCYEKAHETKNLWFVSYVLLQMSESHIKLNEFDQAAVFLNLAEKKVDAESFQVLNKRIQLIKEDLENLSKETQLTGYDIIFNKEDYSIVEKQKGCVNFKSQFILWEILNLLVLHPGTAYSKKQLVELIWKQEYMPLVHDNKVYVTIKRLRELVEPDSDRPKYISRNKEGYYLVKKTQVLVK